MSTIALADVQEVIERSIFEALREELVDKEYLPDIEDFDDTEAGYAAYEAAITAVKVAKGFAIELFSGGTNKAKVVKKVPRIVIKSGSFLPGALGGDPLRIYESQSLPGTGYDALVTPPQTVDYYVNIHIVAETAAQERILNAMVALAIPRRYYLPYYNDANSTFFIRYLNYYAADNPDEGLLEKIYAYQVPDAWDREPEKVAEVSKITQITLHPNIQKYMDGEWGSDAGDLIVQSGD